jgi:hypothetical protein
MLSLCLQPMRWAPWFTAALNWAIRYACQALFPTHPEAPTVRRMRPTLEVLEDRTAPSVDITYGGGPTIPHVAVNEIVMGPQPVNTIALMQTLVQNYLPLLGPYYGIGAGTLRSAVNAAPLPGNPTDAQIQNFLMQEISSGAVPPPDGSQLYFIFLAPGQQVSGSPPGATGYHSALPVIMQPGAPLWAIPYDVIFGGSSAHIQISASHELAESVTDPDGVTGYRDRSPTAINGGEVADIYESNPPSTLGGYQVAILSGPQGQKIGSAPSSTPAVPPPAPQDLILLAIEEAEALAFQYLSAFHPQLTPYARSANAVLNANPLHAAPQGQMGVLLGQALFYNWLSQQNGG